MKALLMYRDCDFDLRLELPYNESSLTQDLALDTLLHAMTDGDEFLFDVARAAMFSGLQNDMDTILYRQEILKDCLKNSSVIRELYALTVDALEEMRDHWWGMSSDWPESMLHSSIKLLEALLDKLRKLRSIAEKQAHLFKSEGFIRLFTMFGEELSDEYLAQVQNHLTELKFNRGVLLSVELGNGNEGGNYTLRKVSGKKISWLRRLLGLGLPGYTFRLHDRDHVGSKILSDIRDQGISRVAIALAQSSEHVRSFFNMLRTEMAFYICCLNLHGRLAGPVCFPHPVPAGERRHRFSGLYDANLSLVMGRSVVGNAIDAESKGVVIISGANQGGKSVFLRSIGLAQIMMQCGMFVTAESFEGELCTGLFTHYKREEDVTMKGGKLDEELARMSDIADHIAPNSMLLCNESFAATNEREGSEIARQIVCALLDRHIKIFFVTHLYEFAHNLFEMKRKDALFLLAERLPDGTRTYRLVEGEPLETSYGEDLYREIFPDEIENHGTTP
jgi:hypothetical protein